jgi:hypothetical protein
MRRFFVILLLAILPLQLVWASAATYCEHEAESVSTKHFGHHLHIHKSDGDSTELKVKVHHDCSVCHTVAGQAVLQQIQHFLASMAGTTLHWSPPEPQPAIAPSSVPERPQWTRLV